MPPALPQVLDILRKNQPKLRELGVLHAAVFGSVARGESGQDSDVDIVIDLDPDRRLGVFEYSRIILDIQDLIGTKTDVVSRDSIKPLLHEPMVRDAVHAF